MAIHKLPALSGTLCSLFATATMTLYASRRCLDVVGRVAGTSSSLSRSWSATLVFQHRCYAARATAQKLKEKPAVNAAAPPSTARTAGKAVEPKKAAREDTASERTTEDELKAIEALHRMTETNEVDISSAPLELLGESRWPVFSSRFISPGSMRRVYICLRCICAFVYRASLSASSMND